MLLSSRFNIEMIVTCLIILFLVTTRLSMAVGNILYILILCISTIWIILKRKNISFSSDFITGLKVYLFMLLCFFPSIVFSEYPLKSFIYFLNIFVWKVLIILPIFFIVKRKLYLYSIVLTFLCWIGVDSFLAFEQWREGLYLHEGRAGGINDNGIMGMAMLLTFGFPVSLICAYDNAVPKLMRRISWITLCMMLLGMWANQSRASWLFNGLNITWISIKYGIKKIKYLLILLLMGITITGLFSYNQHYVERFVSTFNTTTDGSNLGRIYVWESSIEMILEHPIVGVGPGVWRQTYREHYKKEQEVQDLNHTHNNMIQIAAESGLIGLFGFLVLNYFFIYKWTKKYMVRQSPYLLAGIAGWISYIFLFGSIDYTLGNSAEIKIVLIIMATLFRINSLSSNDKSVN